MHKEIRRRIRHRSAGLDLAADLNAVVSVNVNEGAAAAPREATADKRVETDEETEPTKGGAEDG
jgi:hypothetical protein